MIANMSLTKEIQQLKKKVPMKLNQILDRSMTQKKMMYVIHVEYVC